MARSIAARVTEPLPGVRQLLSPLSYLRIKQSVKFHYDVSYPFIIAAIALAGAYFLPEKVNVFGKNGVVLQITELLKMLIGFYIASLAAIATFQAKSLDQPLAGSAATLNVLRNGVEIPKTLSRRQFLSYLFGYLAFMSLAMFILGLLATSLAGDIRSIVPEWTQPIMKWSFAGIYALAISHMLIATLVGLHYLTDRIHRPPDLSSADSKTEDKG